MNVLCFLCCDCVGLQVCYCLLSCIVICVDAVVACVFVPCVFFDVSFLCVRVYVLCVGVVVVCVVCV